MLFGSMPIRLDGLLGLGIFGGRVGNRKNSTIGSRSSCFDDVMHLRERSNGLIQYVKTPCNE